MLVLTSWKGEHCSVKYADVMVMFAMKLSPRIPLIGVPSKL